MPKRLFLLDSNLFSIINVFESRTRPADRKSMLNVRVVELQNHGEHVPGTGTHPSREISVAKGRALLPASTALVQQKLW